MPGFLQKAIGACADLGIRTIDADGRAGYLLNKVDQPFYHFKLVHLNGCAAVEVIGVRVGLHFRKIAYEIRIRAAMALATKECFR